MSGTGVEYIFLTLTLLLQKNHLSGLKRKYLKLQFDTVQQLMRVRNDLLHVVEKNEEKIDAVEAFESVHGVKRCLYTLQHPASLL